MPHKGARIIKLWKKEFLAEQTGKLKRSERLRSHNVIRAVWLAIEQKPLLHGVPYGTLSFRVNPTRLDFAPELSHGFSGGTNSFWLDIFLTWSTFPAANVSSKKMALASKTGVDLFRMLIGRKATISLRTAQTLYRMFHLDITAGQARGEVLYGEWGPFFPQIRCFLLEIYGCW